MTSLDFGVTILCDPPCSRFVELFQLAEANGFSHGWTYDSHILWQDGYAFLTVTAMETERIKLGHFVTNPGIRDPTATASAYATLQSIFPGRMAMGMGRGDSSLRVIGRKPVGTDEFERSVRMIKELMNGRPVEWNGRRVQLEWATGLPEIPLYVAGSGPRSLGVVGRVGDGVIVGGADPDMVEWVVSLARAAARAAGRDPDELEVVVSAPVHVGSDLARARDELRWYPAMVANANYALLSKADPDELPPALKAFLESFRAESYDYVEHSKVGARHGESVTDDMVDRFCLLGPLETQLERVRGLQAAGVTQLNCYLMGDCKDEIIQTYGREVLPRFAAAREATRSS
jgi:probable F420-dependent oxidoreductase